MPRVASARIAKRNQLSIYTYTYTYIYTAGEFGRPLGGKPHATASMFGAPEVHFELCASNCIGGSREAQSLILTSNKKHPIIKKCENSIFNKPIKNPYFSLRDLSGWDRNGRLTGKFLTPASPAHFYFFFIDFH